MSSNYVALRALYEATNGALWRDTYTNGTSFPGNVGWLSGSDVCSWQWVVCADGRVTELELYSNHLVGTLPSQLALLSNLRHFRAAGAANRGRISGTIPQNMSSLLATLELGGNQLSGTIPSTLRAPFVSFNVGINSISGTLPSALIDDDLTEFTVGTNAISGFLPTELGRPRSLSFLGISYSRFSGTMPTQIGRATSLRTLYAGDNHAISGVLPSQLGHLTLIETMWIDTNKLSGTLPPSVGGLTRLSALGFGPNPRLSGYLPSEFGLLTAITQLRANACAFSGTLPSEFGQLAKVNDLFLYANSLSGMLPSQLGLTHPDVCFLTQKQCYRLDACGYIPRDGNTFTCPLPPLSSVCASNMQGFDAFSASYCNVAPSPPPSPPPPPPGSPPELPPLPPHPPPIRRVPPAWSITAGTIGVLIALSICYCLIIESRRASKRTEDELLIQLGELRKNDFMDVRVDGADEPVELRAYLIEAMTELGMAPIDDTPRGSGPQAQQSVRPQQSVRHPQQSDFDAAVMDAVPLGSYWRIARAGLTNRLASMKASMKASPKASSKASAGSSGARRGSGVMPILTEHGVTTKAGESVAEGSSSGEADEQTRFACSSLEELVLGEPADAALGVAHLMRASPAAVRAGMLRGVREVEAEFEAFCAIVAHHDQHPSGLPPLRWTSCHASCPGSGRSSGLVGLGNSASASAQASTNASARTSCASASADDGAAVALAVRPWWATTELAEEAAECMRYCLHEAAGSSDLLFPNSPHGRDRDEDGLRADRRTPLGDGMRLADFAMLPQARAPPHISHILPHPPTLPNKDLSLPRLGQLCDAPAGANRPARGGARRRPPHLHDGRIQGAQRPAAPSVGWLAASLPSDCVLPERCHRQAARGWRDPAERALRVRFVARGEGPHDDRRLRAARRHRAGADVDNVQPQGGSQVYNRRYRSPAWWRACAPLQVTYRLVHGARRVPHMGERLPGRGGDRLPAPDLHEDEQ